MRALVTGGTGFIGANLALHLESIGWNVVVLDRSRQLANLQDFKGEIQFADLAEVWNIDGNFDVLFHQAAITDPRYPKSEELYQKNLDGFKRVIEFATKKSARIVYASTAGLYGNGPVPMREDQSKELLTTYARSKLDMDLLAETLFQELPIVGLRYFNVFGPKEGHKGRPASMIYHLYHQMRAGNRPRIFKYGEQERDFIYVKDVVKANLCAITALSGVYNVGTGIGTTFNQLVEVLNGVLGTNLPPEYFDMPYDPFTYQHKTIADTTLARASLGFTAEWQFARAVEDYVEFMSESARRSS